MKKLLMLLTIFAMMVMFNGCTMYSVEKQMPDGSFTNVNVKSTRSFEQPDLHYTREGNDATFDFQAAGADNNTDAFMGMFQGIFGMMSTMMETMTMNMAALQRSMLETQKPIP